MGYDPGEPIDWLVGKQEDDSVFYQEYEEVEKAMKDGCITRIKNIDFVSYMYLSYKAWYYLGDPKISDQDFDAFEEVIKRQMPNSPVLRKVGELHITCKKCRAGKDH